MPSSIEPSTPPSSGEPNNPPLPEHERLAVAPLKLHLRLCELPGHTYRVLSLRPSCGVRFSNNFFHDTWHLLSDLNGSALLARLLWGLSYQRHAGTVIALYGEHIVETPFEADPALPCLLTVANSPASASFDETHLDGLRRWLRRPGPPATTVKLQTFGMAAAIARYQDRSVRYEGHDEEWIPLWARERMSKRAGLLCYTAPPEILRAQALTVHGMSRFTYRGSNYHYLAEGRSGRRASTYRAPSGEVQIFSDFTERLITARAARAQVVVDPATARGPLNDEARRAIWDSVERALERRVAERKRRTSVRHQRARDAEQPR